MTAEHYAESVAIGGMCPDGAHEFGVRLARFPPRRSATLWLSAYVDGAYYAAADAELALTAPGITPVGGSEAVFEVSGTSRGRFESTARHTVRMRGRAIAVSSGHRAAHVEPGKGDVPMSIDAEFEVVHLPVMVRPGRMEVMGRVRATLRIAERSYALDEPGKWHEQTGDRPRFGPPFTYIFVQGPGIGVMASRHPTGAYGYVLRDGRTTLVQSLEIDPYGNRERGFEVGLVDNTRFKGTAHVLREVSVPIEGQRRPGATVRVTSELGEMVGHLNDWNPKDWNPIESERRGA